ncbi:TonB-dependent receptor [Methylobacillus flagellatus]|uniref:TonB-dependent receptor n=1 Tax=Methylobacillus flagellatus (strain ATCC 51484 / DSM 6875 / VKM B-1610 / KT) TaxID=265072 RepID=Q1GYR9_METFK|nr:TonB-dependent receptor [Methylobacillus flagellatus]ABE50618.1 TonB-dependent receptor [Methylobacillus flagellatus KT]
MKPHHTQLRPFRRRGISLALAAALLSAGIPTAFAVEETTKAENKQTSADQEAQPALGTVTVTATRREASLQSIPVAVSVLDGRKLEQSNLNSIQTIANEVPSLTFRQQGGNKDSSIFIRGVGTISTSPGIEPTVSTVIDGVVYARPGQATLDLMDVERIEILRGPQGTLFGKNASAGVINIVTKEPSADLHAYVDTSYYEGGEKRIRFGLSGTLVPDLLYASINGLWADYDGNVKNLLGGRLNGYEREGARAKFLLTPNEDLDITLIADYTHGTNGVIAVPYQTTDSTFTQAISPVQVSKGNRTVRSDGKNEVTDTNQGISAQVDWRINDYTLTSITAFRTWDNKQNTSVSGIGNNYDPARIATGYPATWDRGTVDSSQFSQEVRIASPKDKFVEYVAGVYYLKSKTDEVYQRYAETISGANYFGRSDYGVENDSISLFGESTLNFTPEFRGIAGLRYTHDELSFDHVRNSNVPSGIQSAVRASQPLRKGTTSASEYSGRLGAQYDLSKDAMVYATYSRGYKGPAYNVFFNMFDGNNDTAPLEPETANSFEIGLKSALLDNRLIFNAAAFYTKYKNYQANAPEHVGNNVYIYRLINAGEVSTRGVELDVNAKVTSRLSFSGSLAYVDARIDNLNCPPTDAACQVNGKPLPFSPKWKSAVRANYAIPLNNGYVIDLGTDYIWQSKQQFSLIPQTDATIQEAYGIWNASVALSTQDGWRFALVGRNLLDRSYASTLSGNASVAQRYVPRDDARYFGVQVRKDF